MTKKTRDLAVKICQMHASNLGQHGLSIPLQVWQAMGISEYSEATTIAWLAACKACDLNSGTGVLTNEEFAEAESMLRTGWEPSPEDLR